MGRSRNTSLSVKADKVAEELIKDDLYSKVVSDYLEHLADSPDEFKELKKRLNDGK